MSVLRLTPEQVAQHQQRVKGNTGIIPGIKTGEKEKSARKPLAGRNKYGNEKVIDADGKTIDSKKEQRIRQELRARFRAGEITELAEQVWIRLSENRRMVVDFVYVEADGTRRYVDAKGYATPEWKLKQDWARELGIEVETI